MSDVYQTITDAIVAAIEAGADGKAWAMPWHRNESGAALPTNATTGRPYRGINTVVLLSAQLERGYTCGQWATYRAWQSVGAQVRKGERSTTAVFWKFDKRTADDGTEQRSILARAYALFNRAQVDNAPPIAAPVIAEPNPDGRIAEAEAFFAAIGAEVRHGGNQAFYAPSRDFIAMPDFEQFKSGHDYYSTLAHECCHWTGHESRLARDFSGRFGSDAYAFEELVAELGAAFTLGLMGLSAEPRPDHAQYLAHWLRVLKSDKRAIFTAASKAQAAADFLAKAGGLMAAPTETTETEAA